MPTGGSIPSSSSAPSTASGSGTTTSSQSAAGSQDSTVQSGGPITTASGPGKLHTVRAGECISSIARDTGHFWEKIWNDSGNAELKQARQDSNVLLAGDIVHIPNKTSKTETGATEQIHRFRRRGEPSLLRMQVLDNDEIQANCPYTLEVDGELFTGTTDAQGKFEQPIPGNAKRGRLIVGPQRREYPLDLGGLDPITEMTGVQGRLRNLEYDVGQVDGTLSDKTKTALEQFQTKHGLPATGQPDEATRNKLKEVHGS